jgi:hypothetical protein
MVARFGFWAALAALVAAVGYGIPQIMQVMGLLPDPLDRILIFAPSLLLAPAFVLAMAALHQATDPDRRIWSLAGLALAILYAGFVGVVYVTQLGVVIPGEMRGAAADVALLKCCSTGAFMTAVDLLGYTSMSLATLLAAPAIAGGGVSRWTRLAFAANGVLAPFLIAQLAWPELIYIGALWLITFPLSMLLLTVVFAQSREQLTGVRLSLEIGARD